MTIRYMLDTNTCIYLINNHPKMQPQAALNDCMISVIVQGELLFGCEQSVAATATRNFANQIALAELTSEVAGHYAFGGGCLPEAELCGTIVLSLEKEVR